MTLAVPSSHLGTTVHTGWQRARILFNRRRRLSSESEAEHALRDPFIEDWVEQNGRFRIHNMNEILITPGVTLGSLGVVMLDERVFEIVSADPEHPLNELKAKGVADALRRQDMFEEIKVEPREESV